MIKNANLSHVRPVATAAEYVFEALAVQQARRACARRYRARVDRRDAGAREWSASLSARRARAARHRAQVQRTPSPRAGRRPTPRDLQRLFFGWVKRGSSVEELAHYEFESLDADRNGSVSREEDTRAGWYEKIQKSRWETVDEASDSTSGIWTATALDRSEVVKRAIEHSRVDEAVAVERSCSDGVDGSCSDGEEGDGDEEDDEEDDEEATSSSASNCFRPLYKIQLHRTQTPSTSARAEVLVHKRRRRRHALAESAGVAARACELGAHLGRQQLRRVPARRARDEGAADGAQPHADARPPSTRALSAASARTARAVRQPAHTRTSAPSVGGRRSGVEVPLSAERLGRVLLGERAVDRRRNRDRAGGARRRRRLRRRRRDRLCDGIDSLLAQPRRAFSAARRRASAAISRCKCARSTWSAPRDPPACASDAPKQPVP